jgi:hypothetical protein
MDSQDNYWYRRYANRGVTRRRFMGGAAVGGAGALALGLVGCGDDDDDDDDSGAGDGGPTVAPTQASNQPVKGGTARFTSANNTWDTFDIDRSIFSTTAAYVLALDNLGVVHYDSFAESKLGLASPRSGSSHHLQR